MTNKGQRLIIEPLSYRYTERGNVWLYRNKETNQIMEIQSTGAESYDGMLFGTLDIVHWDLDKCELIAVKWDNRPEFKDNRRGPLDCIKIVNFKYSNLKLRDLNDSIN